MSQVKKRRKLRKVKWKSVAVLAVACVLVVYLFASLVGMLFGDSSSDPNAFKVCKLSNSKLQKQLGGKPYEGTMAMQDFVFYGEGLTFYSDPYTLDSYNNFEGKTMALVNICTGNEIEISKVDSSLDGQINLGELPVGLYEVYVKENLLKKRVFTPERITADNSIYTVTRNKSNNKVEILANAALLNDKDSKENVLDKNYVFINVTKETLPKDVYDVVINPGPITVDNKVDVKVGELSSQQEMYRLANKMKEGLEKEGLKVLISRSENEILSTYGTEGTLIKGYDGQAKYFISLVMYNANSSTKGMTITHSSYTSDVLAKEIYTAVVEGTSLDGKNQAYDVVSSTPIGLYDTDVEIREAGGRALAAATYSDRSKDNSFAADLPGMNAISIEVFNANNAVDVETWKLEFDKIASQMTLGFLKYLGIKK